MNARLSFKSYICYLIVNEPYGWIYLLNRIYKHLDISWIFILRTNFRRVKSSLGVCWCGVLCVNGCGIVHPMIWNRWIIAQIFWLLFTTFGLYLRINAIKLIRLDCKIQNRSLAILWKRLGLLINFCFFVHFFNDIFSFDSDPVVDEMFLIFFQDVINNCFFFLLSLSLYRMRELHLLLLLRCEGCSGDWTDLCESKGYSPIN